MLTLKNYGEATNSNWNQTCSTKKLIFFTICYYVKTTCNLEISRPIKIFKYLNNKFESHNTW